VIQDFPKHIAAHLQGTHGLNTKANLAKELQSQRTTGLTDFYQQLCNIQATRLISIYSVATNCGTLILD
jgi:hypothetical protein